jgi:geranylgeranyl diphosphate synthase type I
MLLTESVAAARPLSDCFAEAGRLVEPLIAQAVSGFSTHSRRVVGYQRGWCDPEGHEPGSAAGSPHWFACIALLGGRAVGGSDSRVLPAAVVAELVHDACIICDDITDGDDLRYGSPATWKVFGVGQSITAAIAIQTLAGQLPLALDPVVALLAANLTHRAFEVAAHGQSWDVAQQGRSDTSWDRCLAMCQEKTGALIAGAAALGGLLGGAGKEQIEALHSYGWWCGLAGQIFNDVEDIWKDQSSFGRQKSDLRARRVTLPVAAALGVAGPARDRLAALYDSGRALSDEEVHEAANLIEITGGRARAIAARDDAALRAVEALAALPPTSARAELAQLVEVATRCSA